MKIFNKSVFVFISGLFITINACSRIDDSNPLTVVSSFVSNVNSKIFETSYNLISEKSKKEITLDELSEYYSPKQFKTDRAVVTKKIQEIKNSVIQPTYRRFMVDEIVIQKKDTFQRLQYFSLVNENNKWRVCWNGSVVAIGDEKFSKGDFDGAKKYFQRAIELNPYDGLAFSKIAECDYYNHNNGDEIANNIKYAISLEPENPYHYHTLGLFYSMIKQHDLAIEAFLKTLNLTQFDKGKPMIFVNIAIEYLAKQEYNMATQSVINAMKLDSINGYAWKCYGDILCEVKKYTDAYESYLKALNYGIEDNSTLSVLLFQLAYSSYKIEEYNVSLKYILRALEFDPNNKLYQQLYSLIRRKAGA